MAVRRISKASKRRLSIFGTLSLIAIIYFIFNLFYSTYNIYSLTMEKKNLENNYVKLQEEAENLKIDIEKLNDEEYLANYARENYLYSKDGEYILQLGEDITETSNTLDIINIKINRNYMLIGLCILILLMFIYIISKSTKKNKKR